MMTAYYILLIQCSYVTELQKPHAARKLDGSMFYRTGVIANKRSLHCRNRDFRSFCSHDLDLDPMTFIYELDLYPTEIYQTCENDLPTLRFLKVII